MLRLIFAIPIPAALLKVMGSIVNIKLLFSSLMTSAGWNDVLESLMIQPPDCELGESGGNGNCGSPLLAITYFTSFIIISYMIVINMYIAIILENFNQAHQEEEIGIVEDDLEMFYIRWSKYDLFYYSLLRHLSSSLFRYLGNLTTLKSLYHFSQKDS